MCLPVSPLYLHVSPCISLGIGRYLTPDARWFGVWRLAARARRLALEQARHLPISPYISQYISLYLPHIARRLALEQARHLPVSPNISQYLAYISRTSPAASPSSRPQQRSLPTSPYISPCISQYLEQAAAEREELLAHRAEEHWRARGRRRALGGWRRAAGARGGAWRRARLAAATAAQGRLRRGLRGWRGAAVRVRVTLTLTLTQALTLTLTQTLTLTLALTLTRWRGAAALWAREEAAAAAARRGATEERALCAAFWRCA